MTDGEIGSGDMVDAVLSAIARDLQAEPDLDSTLAAIVKAAVGHIAGAERAGISLVENRHRICTVAVTDDLVVRIDDLQYRTRQGPASTRSPNTTSTAPATLLPRHAGPRLLQPRPRPASAR